MNAFSSDYIWTKPDTTFDIGDIVNLVTGSPDMVVVDVCECGNVDVVWYDDVGFSEARLPEEALTHA